MKLSTLKAAAMGLRSLHRIAQQLKRQNDNYEAVHEFELRQARMRHETVDTNVGKVYYQSDRKLHEQEIREKVERAVRAGEYDDGEIFS